MSSFATTMKKTALVAALLTTVAPVVVGGAFGAGVAKADVIVRGNQRIESETIRSYVVQNAKGGDTDAVLKALYATDLFADVRVSREGGSTVVTVTENPQINKIAFEGNKRLTDDQLKQVIQMKSRGFMSKSDVQSDTQRLLEAYRRNGRYRAAVDPKIISLPDNRVNLVYEIDEGDKTAVTRISFSGNKSYSNGRLRDIVKTRETGLLGWLRTTDTYDPDRLQQDQDALRKFYMKNGYADFRVVSATADLDRERNVFFVGFTIDEGDQYSYGDIDVQTSLANLDGRQLSSAVGTKSGNVYSSEEVEKTMEELSLAASRAGYPFAQVRPRAVRDYAKHTISITYYVEEGPRVYVERINVRGNDRTRDYVVRREFDMAEGDAFNKALVSKAERRLNRLGLFKNVKVATESGSAPDKIVVNVDVEEQPTGEIGFGAGYSTADGVIGDVSFSEKNFLGRGQYVKASVQYGKSTRGFVFSFTEPYFLGYRISAGFDVYRKEALANSYRSYDERNTGGTLRFGLPISENLTFGVSYNINQQELKLASTQANDVLTDGEASLAYKYYVCGASNCSSVGTLSRTRLTSAPGFNLVYNSLDNVQFPRDGIYAKWTEEFAGAGGDARYIRSQVDARYYRELWADWGVIGMARARAGNITGVGKKVEVIDNFFQGGETIRGFASQGYGPRDTYTKEALGGRNFWTATVEASMPVPGTPEEFGLYMSAFADAGQLWSVDKSSLPVASATFDPVDDNKVRASVGVGIMWRSPFGPLRADFGIPVSKSKYDQTQVFRFSGGTTF
ncbi:MAG: outer membrane protein assembly factor BamA [Hyphomicrobiales bacterium]|nr:outer membrane protein assembly factor BamA [Hyphomicrobiales bacterium]